MKFEKLNENKIRITLNNQDLMEKNIDLHSFMSNSKESQNLFLDMLDEAEKKVGFITKDYKLRIEALALSDGNFILTITRFGKNIDSLSKNEKKQTLRIKRKSLDTLSKQLIYRFESFDDFCFLCNFISKLNNNFYSLTKTVSLYSYNNIYYLYISNIGAKQDLLKQLHTILSEFGTYIDNSELFARKLSEHGKLIIKNNAIKICNNYFNKNAINN